MQNTRVPNMDRPSQESLFDTDFSWLRRHGDSGSPSGSTEDVAVECPSLSALPTDPVKARCSVHCLRPPSVAAKPTAASPLPLVVTEPEGDASGLPRISHSIESLTPERCEPNSRAVSLMTTGPDGGARVDAFLGPTLSPEDVAQRLGTSPWWVREQVRAGRVHHLRLGKGRIRFLPEHVRELVVLCTVAVSELTTAAVPTSSAPNSLGALGGTSRSQRAHGLSGSSSS